MSFRLSRFSILIVVDEYGTIVCNENAKREYVFKISPLWSGACVV